MGSDFPGSNITLATECYLSDYKLRYSVDDIQPAEKKSGLLECLTDSALAEVKNEVG